MISLTVSIFLLCFACIAYPKDPVPVRRTAIAVLTIIDVILTVLYLIPFSSIAAGIFECVQLDIGIMADDVILLILLFLPISVALPAIFFGAKVLLDRGLIAKGMAKQAEEESLKNMPHKFCADCNTSNPYHATECKHCKSTVFTTEPPSEVNTIPQQIRNNTPSDDEKITK